MVTGTLVVWQTTVSLFIVTGMVTTVVEVLVSHSVVVVGIWVLEVTVSKAPHSYVEQDVETPVLYSVTTLEPVSWQTLVVVEQDVLVLSPPPEWPPPYAPLLSAEAEAEEEDDEQEEEATDEDASPVSEEDPQPGKAKALLGRARQIAPAILMNECISRGDEK